MPARALTHVTRGAVLALCAAALRCAADGDRSPMLVDLSEQELSALCDEAEADYAVDPRARAGECNLAAGGAALNPAVTPDRPTFPSADQPAQLAACEDSKRTCSIGAMSSPGCVQPLVAVACVATVADYHECHQAALAQAREHASFSCADELRWLSERFSRAPAEPTAIQQTCAKVRACFFARVLDNGVIQLPP